MLTRSFLIHITCMCGVFITFPQTAKADTIAGYLFAHMTKTDYGRLYYSVSPDGRNWTLLNDGKRITDDYRGHPDICTGHDGRHYLIGNISGNCDIKLWVSEDLLKWDLFGIYEPDVNKAPDFKSKLRYHGAPKIFFDDRTRQYLLTWHTPTEPGDKDDPEKHWRSMRTLYSTSKDLKVFSDPRRLLAVDMATIDVIIRREEDTYYALIKDEMYPSFDWPTGKTIRISSASKLTGPFPRPGPPITPNFREAPTLIPAKGGNGWLLYYEQYPGVSYGLSLAPRLAGPWYDEYCMKYTVPENARHGCMIPLTQGQLDAITTAFAHKAGRN